MVLSSWKFNASISAGWGVTLVVNSLRGEIATSTLAFGWSLYFFSVALKCWRRDAQERLRERIRVAVETFWRSSTPIPPDLAYRLGLDFENDPDASEAILGVILPLESLGVRLTLIDLDDRLSWRDIVTSLCNFRLPQKHPRCRYYCGKLNRDRAIAPNTPCGTCSHSDS
jgi:hypothetical protein